MADGAAAVETEAPRDWPLRPWVLGAVGAIAGLLIFFLVDGNGDDVPWRVAGAAFFAFGGLALALTLDRENWIEASLFSLVIATVLGGLAWHAIWVGERLAGEEFAFAAGIFASLLAVPLFQAGFHRRRFATPYAETHYHVWNDAVSGAGAIAFAGLSWLVLWLVHGLLNLVGIDIIEHLIEEEWFALMWTGASFGAAMGVLRNQQKIIGSLQAVVMLVLSLLAVPLAVALLVFLVALLASGGSALWDATDDATPILLTCAAGAFIIANAVFRDSDAARSGSKVMLASAMVLAAGVLPLALFAAISMGIRIDQYGLAPERIWALVAIAVAVAYGLAYWVGLARGRRAGWSGQLRSANLNLAVAVCVLALILALPIFDFGAVSTRNQLARLEAGAVSVEEFDYAALRWDFGDAGREALGELAEGEGRRAELAQAALDQSARPYGWARAPRTDSDFDLRVQPESEELRALVLDYLRANPYQCSEFCVALDLGGSEGMRDIALLQGRGYARIRLSEADGTEQGVPLRDLGPALERDSTVEIRNVETPYIFVDGQPVREPLDPLEALDAPR